ncbi:MAG: LysM peptidoglycan-binding domain-containing protein [Euzebya sp.]
MDFDYEGTDEFGGRVLWARVGVFAIAALLIFGLGRCTKGGGDVEQADFDALFTSNASAQAELATARPLIARLQQENQDLVNPQAGSPGVTPSGTPAPGATSPATTDGQGNRIYEVQAGDTLSTIAQQVYNDPTAFGIIANANNLSGSSPLQVGQELIIPDNPDAAQ